VAKQNQKFPFHFLSAPPTPPAEEKKKGKENFWFLLPRPQGADEARRVRFTTRSARTIRFQATTHAERAKSLVFPLEKSSRKVYNHSNSDGQGIKSVFKNSFQANDLFWGLTLFPTIFVWSLSKRDNSR
jgi:hypothetical protein